jgi:hypothetical protein
MQALLGSTLASLKLLLGKHSCTLQLHATKLIAEQLFAGISTNQTRLTDRSNRRALVSAARGSGVPLPTLTIDAWHVITAKPASCLDYRSPDAHIGKGPATQITPKLIIPGARSIFPNRWSKIIIAPLIECMNWWSVGRWSSDRLHKSSWANKNSVIHVDLGQLYFYMTLPNLQIIRVEARSFDDLISESIPKLNFYIPPPRLSAWCIFRNALN